MVQAAGSALRLRGSGPRAAGHAAKQMKEKRQRQLEEAKKANEAKLAEEIDQWWKDHDENGDGTLNQEEFTAMMKAVFPDTEMDERLVSKLMGIVKGEVTKDKIRPVLAKYRGYLKDKSAIDAIFTRFDANSDGKIDKTEMLPLLKACASNVESIPVDQVGEDDVEHVCTMADQDGSGDIDREEIQLALASWKDEMASINWSALEKDIAADAEAKEKKAAAKSSACLIL